MNFIAQGAAGNTFYGNTTASGGPRVGWTTTLGSWLADLVSAVVNGAPWTFTTWQTCVLNSAVSATSPVLIEELDANGNVIATTMVTSLTPCQDITLNPLTRRVRIRGGGGSSADANAFGGKGGPS
jgi:hypothetical protein